MMMMMMHRFLKQCLWKRVYQRVAGRIDVLQPVFFFLPLPAAELETSPPVSRLMNAAAQAASSFMYPSMCSLDHILERRGKKCLYKRQ